MPVLFADAGDSKTSGEGAMHCCKLLIWLYTKQNRKKDLKAMLNARKDGNRIVVRRFFRG